MTALECSVSPNFEFNVSWNGISGLKVLHVSTPDLAEWLLKHGADPKTLNSDGETPLDFALSTSGSPLAKVGLGYQHEYCCVLLKFGGSILKTSTEQWRAAKKRFSSNGFDVSSFMEHDSTGSDCSKTSNHSETKEHLRMGNPSETMEHLKTSNHPETREHLKDGQPFIVEGTHSKTKDHSESRDPSRKSDRSESRDPSRRSGHSRKSRKPTIVLGAKRK